MAAPYLRSKAAHQDEGIGGGGDFLSTSDGRVSKMNLHVNLLRKTTVSYSFDPQRKVCMQCSERAPILCWARRWVITGDRLRGRLSSWGIRHCRPCCPAVQY